MSINPIKVVLDTNIFISALISGKNCLEILKLWKNNIFELYTSKEIIQEIESVGSRPNFKKYFSTQQLNLLISLIWQKSTLTYPSNKIPKKYLSKDTSDNIFVSCVLQSRANFFVTGNTKHFTQLKTITKLTNPKQFLESIKQ
ncbi:putative toxin-antitoxin system toxin component, PIN family [Patescibacteria group bacterium]|nr:putative toxin-antitoxin system toxin component, PIN family [Patescibacteria group bacterium]